MVTPYPPHPRRHRHLRRAGGAPASGPRATTSRCCRPAPRPPTTTSTCRGRAGPAGPGQAGARLRPGHRPVPPRRLLPGAVQTGRRSVRRQRRPGGSSSGVARDVEVRVHEVDYALGPRRRRSAARAARAHVARGRPRVVVHTEAERQALPRRLRGRRPTGSTWSTTVPTSCAAPRRRPAGGPRPRSGIPDDEFMFLVASASSSPTRASTGPSRAFAGAGRAGRRLDVVGSVRVEERGLPRLPRGARRAGRGHARRHAAHRLRRATRSSTSGWWPPTWSCCRTGTSGRRACSSGPRSTAAR